MDAVLQVAGPVNAQPVGHPDVPRRAVGIGDFIEHTEGSNTGRVSYSGGGNETENKIIGLVDVHVLLGNIHQDGLRPSVGWRTIVRRGAVVSCGGGSG